MFIYISYARHMFTLLDLNQLKSHIESEIYYPIILKKIAVNVSLILYIGGEGRIRTFESRGRQIYSLFMYPLSRWCWVAVKGFAKSCYQKQIPVCLPLHHLSIRTMWPQYISTEAGTRQVG